MYPFQNLSFYQNKLGNVCIAQNLTLSHTLSLESRGTHRFCRKSTYMNLKY